MRGWNLGDVLRGRLTFTALQGYWRRHPTPASCLWDQGVQSAATGNSALLPARQVQISMAEVGDLTQNGDAERVGHTIREEALDLGEHRGDAEARCLIGRFLDEVHMHTRMHSSLGYLTRAEFAAQWAQS